MSWFFKGLVTGVITLGLILIILKHSTSIISDLILFATFVVVAFYTWETHKLRRLSQQNFSGLLEPEMESTYKKTNFAGLGVSGRTENSINFRIFFKNIGTGSLRITKFTCDAKSASVRAGQRSPEISFGPRGHDNLPGTLMAPKDTVEMDYIASVPLEYSDKIGVNFSIYYSDGNGDHRHKFRIVNCSTSLTSPSFDLVDEGKGVLKYIGVV